MCFHFLLISLLIGVFFFFFFFNDTATTEIYTLSLHDALPICRTVEDCAMVFNVLHGVDPKDRSEEHTSELQSHLNLVCRLLLEKKKKKKIGRNVSEKKSYKSSSK